MGRKVTSVRSERTSSRSPRATATPVHTAWVRPERAESMANASASLRGFPSRAPSRNTMVSAAMMRASRSPARSRAASAFLRLMKRTISSGGWALSKPSSASGTSISNSSPICSSSCRRRGDWEAKITRISPISFSSANWDSSVLRLIIEDKCLYIRIMPYL